MAQFVSYFIVLALLALAPLCFAHKIQVGYLYPQFYDRSCPQVQQIVKSVVAQAVARERRMAASVLRLHFHDCFIKGCDASVLLDNSGSIVSEKGSKPNKNSIRGFEVIDEIKAAVEKTCPHTVSCADILALAARDLTVIVPLGRRDSRGASIQGSNNEIPAPNNTFHTILTKFKRQRLNLVDLVALSGSVSKHFNPCTCNCCTNTSCTSSCCTSRLKRNYYRSCSCCLVNFTLIKNLYQSFVNSHGIYV